MNTTRHHDRDESTDHDHDAGAMADGGTRTASVEADPSSDPTEYGVLSEDHHDIERVARERGAYLARTTDLAKREARAVAYSELGYSDAGTARRIGVAPTTVTGWLNRTAAQYSHDATFPTVETDRKDLHEVTREEVLEYSPGARETYRGYAVENPGVVPGDVLAALSESEGANNEGDAK